MQVKVLEYKNNEQSKSILKNLSSPHFLRSSKKKSSCAEQEDDQYRRLAIKWILSYSHRNLNKDTQFLAITYINFMKEKSLFFNSENYEIYSVTILLIASKLNEIYPVEIASMLSKCSKNISKQQVIQMEAQILQIFGFEISLENTCYSYLCKLLGPIYGQKLEECQRLLKEVCSNRQIYVFGDEILAYSIIYLIAPKFVKGLQLKEQDKIKSLAMKIYMLYQEQRQTTQRFKQNKCQNK